MKKNTFQPNKQNGEVATQMYLGQRPDALPDDDGGSPNMFGERLANQLWYASLCDTKNLPSAATGMLSFLALQRTTWGHMCRGHSDEALTLSHSPIWERTILSIYLRAYGLRDRFGLLWAEAQEYVRGHYVLLSLLQVPDNAAGVVEEGPKKARIPIAGFVVAPGSRTHTDGPADDSVRRVTTQLARWGRVLTPVGPKFWTPDQSTLGALFAKQIIAGPGFPALTGPPARLRSTLRIVRSEAGHYAEFPNGLKYGSNDSALKVWVRYATGEYAYNTDAPADIVSGEKEIVVEGLEA